MNTTKKKAIGLLALALVSVFLVTLINAAQPPITFGNEYLLSGGAKSTEDQMSSGGEFIVFTEEEPIIIDNGDGVDPGQNIGERITGLPDASELSQVWQLDFSCENAASAGGGLWFAKENPVQSKANIGYSSHWNYLKMVPNIKNPAGENVGLVNYSFDSLADSSGTATAVDFRIDGTAGCYTRSVSGGDTSPQSVTGDYFWIDHISISTYGPIGLDITNLENGTYQMAFLTAYNAGHGREWTVTGEGIDVDVPFKPGSDTLAGNYALSPQITIDDGAINLDVKRGPALAGLAERDGSMAGMVIVRLR